MKKQNKKNFRYEDLKIEWKDLRYRTYTPDFILDNGIIVETKGLFDNEDRRKHLAVREQHPELDIRFLFQRANSPVQGAKKRKDGTKMTCGEWADKHNFIWAEEIIPDGWINGE